MLRPAYASGLFAACLLALAGCGKDKKPVKLDAGYADTSLTRVAADSSGLSGGAPAAGASAGHDYDGFYVNRDYLEALKRSRSVFAAKFPPGSVYLQVTGTAVVLDFSNHEGGNGVLEPQSGSGPLKNAGKGALGNGTIPFRKINDTLFQAWESGTDAPAEFRKLPPDIKTIQDLYGALFLNGTYLCANASRCDDTVVVKGDSLIGWKGVTGLAEGRRHLRLVIDWMDNMPQLDYFDLTGPEASSLAWVSSKGKLELFEIALPADCASLEDHDCELTGSKLGAKVAELKRIGPAGPELRWTE
jgi:hypothetical protein